jgi:DNA-binding transcriptional LysR family regulator
MTLRQMEYFVAVADTGSFSRAAAQLNVSQPGLSQQLQQLERELGARLIDRLPRSVGLTEAGRAYLPEAREALRAASRARRAVQAATSGTAGDLEIATITSVAAGLLPTALRRWRRRFPRVTARLIEYHHRDALEADVEAGRADLAIGPTPLAWKGTRIDLGAETFVVVLAGDDPLADRATVDLTRLAHREWVLFDRDHGLADVTASICGEAGFTPVGALRTSQVDTGVRLAAAGLGPVLVPANVVPAGLDAAVLRLRDPFRRELSAYARGSLSTTARAFVDLIEVEPAGGDSRPDAEP